MAGREPVDIEEAGGAGREVHQPEGQVLVAGMEPLGRLGVDADGPLAGDPGEHVHVVSAQVDGHAHVADAGREGAGPAAGDGVDRGQPAGAQQAPHLQDGRVVSLHVAHLDADVALAGGGHDGQAVVRPWPPAASRPGRAGRARWRPGPAPRGPWLARRRRRRRARRRAIICQRIGETLGPGLGHGGLERGGRRDRRSRPGSSPGGWR